MTEENKNDTNKNVENRYTDPETGKFVPGNPGGGRPPGSGSIVAEIKKMLDDIPEGFKETYRQLLVKKIMRKAVVEGNDKMIKDIVDRVDGKPRQNIGLDGGSDGEPIKGEITVIFKKFNGSNS